MADDYQLIENDSAAWI